MAIKRFAIQYGDKVEAPETRDAAYEDIIGTWYTNAHDLEHALENFYMLNDEEGYTPFFWAIVPLGTNRHDISWKRI